MMLTDLLDAVAATGSLRPRNPLARPDSQLPSYKTSIGYLARALGCPDAQHCPQGTFARSQEELRHALDIYLGSLNPPPTSHTIRNTRYNIRTLFKKAYDAHILQSHDYLPPSSLTDDALRKADRTTSPYKQHYGHKPYSLCQTHWPVDIRAHWDQYALETRRTIRPATLNMRTKCLSNYLGYFHNIAHQPLTVWDDLFTIDHLDAFATWHSARLGVRYSTTARMTVDNLTYVAVHFKHPQIQVLKDYRKTLSLPEPMHNKRDHWISRDELELVALSEFQDSHKPSSTHNRHAEYPGSVRASQNRRSLMLRLLLRIPLRQRNICEMQLHRNLYQDQQDHWWLTFKGEELKVSKRKGKINTFTLDLTVWCSDLIEHLEEYLKDFRPRFPNASTSPYVFLTKTGVPYQDVTLWHDFRGLILKRTNGKRCYPHLLRTLWVSEFFADGGKPATAAYMLNDTVQTALQKYQEFIDADHLQEASTFNQKLAKQFRRE
jgi:hypothetical protein